MSLRDQVTGKNWRNWLRAAFPFQPSVSGTTVVLAAVLFFIAYIHSQQPSDSGPKQMTVCEFADRVIQMAEFQRATTREGQALNALHNLLNSVLRLENVCRAAYSKPWIIDMVAWTEIFARTKPTEETRHLADFAMSEARRWFVQKADVEYRIPVLTQELEVH